MPRRPQEFEDYDAMADQAVLEEAQRVEQDSVRKKRAYNHARRRRAELDEFIDEPHVPADAETQLRKGYKRIR